MKNISVPRLRFRRTLGNVISSHQFHSWRYLFSPFIPANPVFRTNRPIHVVCPPSGYQFGNKSGFNPNPEIWPPHHSKESIHGTQFPSLPYQCRILRGVWCNKNHHYTITSLTRYVILPHTRSIGGRWPVPSFMCQCFVLKEVAAIGVATLPLLPLRGSLDYGTRYAWPRSVAAPHDETISFIRC